MIIGVVGFPTPQGSKRAFVQAGHAVMKESSGDRLRSWRQDVKAAAIAVRPATPIDGPVGVAVVFRFPRPKSHYRTGVHAGQLRDKAPVWPTSRSTGDIDKLQRSTFDALTAAGIWVDDSQVAAVRALKAYVETGDLLGVGATIRIEELT